MFLYLLLDFYVMSETILTIAAHNDDQIIGAGGTLAKYAAEGKRIRTVIMSYGESSHPHLKREVIVKTRIGESFRADKILGGKGVVYLDLKEGSFPQQFHDLGIEDKLLDIIRREKPVMIFTHGIDDFHPDHKAIYKLIDRMISEGKISCPVYSFDVWSVLRFRRRNDPRMVVDVSSTFTQKVKSLLAHESQKVAIGMLLWKMILKDWFNGLVYGHRYAEVFYRLK